MPTLIDQVAVNILTDRLADEFNAERFYMAAYNWCKLNSYDHAAAYFISEVQSERSHQLTIMQHLSGWNVNPVLPTVSDSPTFTGIPDIVKRAYEMEMSLYVKYVNDMSSLDEGCKVFLMEFVEIQNISVMEFNDLMRKVEPLSDVEIRMIEDKIFN
jgi:ferritin